MKFKDVPEAWLDRCSGDGYEDTVEEYRPCAKCGKYPSPDGDDACIANLGKVANACCGHGNGKGYIQFDNGITIRGYFEIENTNYIDMDYEIRSREEILQEIEKLEDGERKKALK